MMHCSGVAVGKASWGTQSWGDPEGPQSRAAVPPPLCLLAWTRQAYGSQLQMHNPCARKSTSVNFPCGSFPILSDADTIGGA